MSRINIPDFTAEASLAATRGRYSAAGMGAAPDGRGAVAPQFSWCYYTDVGLKRCCYCDEFGGGCVCRTAFPRIPIQSPFEAID
jgi:hypothetical protein